MDVANLLMKASDNLSVRRAFGTAYEKPELGPAPERVHLPLSGSLRLGCGPHELQRRPAARKKARPLVAGAIVAVNSAI
jgi:hypothetical protein